MFTFNTLTAWIDTRPIQIASENRPLISLQILGFPNYLPTSCRTSIVMQATNHYPRVSPGALPLTKSPRILGTRLRNNLRRALLIVLLPNYEGEAFSKNIQAISRLQ